MKNLQLSNASNKTKIRHKNDINQTLVSMSVPAKRVLFLAMSQINSRKPFGEDVAFEVGAADFARLCGIELNTAYEQMQAATEELQSTVIKVSFEDLLPMIPRKGESFVNPPAHVKGHRGFNITSYVDYLPNEGTVRLVFSRTMEPYVAMISGDYTTQGLISALRFSDKNTAAMYQLIRKKHSHPATKQRFTIEIEELKYELGLYKQVSKTVIEYAYPKFKEFNRSVIAKSLKTISRETEMDVTCSVAKRVGRAVHSLHFEYSEKDQYELHF